MGTSSTVKFKDNLGGKSEVIVSIYSQYDGYPKGGVGYQLARFLKHMTIVNGFSMDQNDGNHANGVGCLAAQYIQGVKKGIGGTYITVSDDSQDWNYEVDYDGKDFTIVVDNYGDVVFVGGRDEFLEFCIPD